MSDQIIVPVMKVSVFQNKVVQHFPSPIDHIALEGDEAIRLGMTLIDRAYEARGDLKPADGAVKHELVERHRKTLTKRIEVMLNSTREAKKVSNAMLAKEMVQVMLKEVF